MHLFFTTANHLSTTIADEHGKTLYAISTPASSRVTTITKYNRDDSSTEKETMAVIEWDRSLEKTMFRFQGRAVTASGMLAKRAWSNGLYFVGPDKQEYKWKLSAYCWMKLAVSDVALVRFHKKNLGISKPPHAAYLEVALKVAPMLDHIVLTFVYAESLRQQRSRSANNGHHANHTSHANHMNHMNMIAMSTMAGAGAVVGGSAPAPSC